MQTIVGVDFDGTIADHVYPKTGDPVPRAFYWMKRFIDAGAKLVLWTMRDADTLKEAVEYCRSRGIEFWGVNENPEQFEWTLSPKAYCNVYVDDMAACCPLLPNPRAGGRPYVDWDVVGPFVMAKIAERAAR